MKKIQVLMSSYNGEKYIRGQLDSILNQKNIDVAILVRDDGSTDSTSGILEEYSRKYANVRYVLESNIGVKKSFLTLVALSDEGFDYYAFSDQDDVWLEDKLYSAVRILENISENKPLIYGAPVFLYDGEEKTEIQFQNPSELYFGNFLIKNYYPGCTMVFNSKVKQLVNLVDPYCLNEFPLHDHWINLICTACGGRVIIDSEPHMLYRQHSDNTVGERSFIQKMLGNGLLTHSENIRYRICEELSCWYSKYYSEEGIALSDMIIRYKESLKNRIRLLRDRRIKPITWIEKMAERAIILLGKF